MYFNIYLLFLILLELPDKSYMRDVFPHLFVVLTETAYYSVYSSTFLYSILCHNVHKYTRTVSQYLGSMVAPTHHHFVVQSIEINEIISSNMYLYKHCVYINNRRG